MKSTTCCASQALQFMTKVIHELYDVDPQSLRDRLEVIVKDEEMHQEPLATIVRILGPREQQQEESKPL